MRSPTQGGRLATRWNMHIQIITYGWTHVLHGSVLDTTGAEQIRGQQSGVAFIFARYALQLSHVLGLTARESNLSGNSYVHRLQPGLTVPA